ncbi:hypothetical protein ACFZC5_29855 [Nocardia gamkensis]|uniref:hypothetical protein n=1 Tax=Nocardia gamkensis TaxID=352869 RepID=UPI0036F17165
MHAAGDIAARPGIAITAAELRELETAVRQLLGEQLAGRQELSSHHRGFPVC